MKRRLVRVGDELADDNQVVVRGGALDPRSLRADAIRNQKVYGSFAISVLAIRDGTLDELAQQSPLVRFEVLTLMVVGELRSAGLRLQPTGRNRHHYSVVFDDVEDGIARLCASDHRVIANPYHES